jgi:hypothetical protein
VPDSLVAAAVWIALGCALGALAVAAWAGWRAWQDWRRLRIVREAATALVDVHVARLEESVAVAGDRLGHVADHGEQLAESIAELRADVTHLRWLLDRIPAERARLRSAIGDLLLPTKERPDDRDRT